MLLLLLLFIAEQMQPKFKRHHIERRAGPLVQQFQINNSHVEKRLRECAARKQQPSGRSVWISKSGERESSKRAQNTHNQSSDRCGQMQRDFGHNGRVGRRQNHSAKRDQFS